MYQDLIRNELNEAAETLANFLKDDANHDLTGGVYKARERIHRGVAEPLLLATPPSWSRVADSNPN